MFPDHLLGKKSSAWTDNSNNHGEVFSFRIYISIEAANTHIFMVIPLFKYKLQSHKLAQIHAGGKTLALGPDGVWKTN